MHRLPTDLDVHRAAIARLASWSPADVEGATAAVARLLDSGVPIDDAQPAVAAVLRRLERPGERRGMWSALVASVALLAEARGDAALFWRAGVVLLQAEQQATRARRSRAGDALDEIITENLRRRPGMTARALFEHCRALAALRATAIVDADAESLDYQPNPTSERLCSISFRAFEVRVSRIRKRLELIQPAVVSSPAEDPTTLPREVTAA